MWLDRNHLLSVPPSESVDNSTVKWTISPFTPDAADTVASSSSIASIKEPSLSKDSDAINSSLQGAWGSSKMTAAAMIKKNIGPNVLPSRSMTTPGGSSRRSSSGESDLSGNTSSRYPSNSGLKLSSSCGSNSDLWKSKSSIRDNQEYGRSQSSGERNRYYRNDRKNTGGMGGDKEQGGGRGTRNTGGVGGDKELGGGRGTRRGNSGGTYYRSVSDVPGGQQRQRGGGGGGGAGNRRGHRQPYSEPHNKRN